MKRQFNPDPIPLRTQEYEKLDGELLHALVETIESLKQQGITLPDSMATVLEKRNQVKNKYRKV